MDILFIILILAWLVSLVGWFFENRQRKTTMLYLSDTFDKLANEQTAAERTETKDGEKRFYRGAALAFKMAKKCVDKELQN